MRRIDLREHDRSEPYALTAEERGQLAAVAELAIDPSEQDGTYHLRAGSTVGAVQVGDLSVFIRPKIGIPQLLSLAWYAMGQFKPHHTDFAFVEEESLPDVLALSLAAASRRAFRRGLLHGYRTEEESLYGIRGRVRFDDQLRRRFGVMVPVEVRYDEFTDDILANQLVKAATMRLTRMRIRSNRARRGLGRVAGTLGEVSPADFPRTAVPSITFDRLNEHYRAVVTLARIILRHSAFEAERGEVRASGFLVDMNKLFQEFVTQALREALGVSERIFRSDRRLPHRISLDEDDRIRLKPDLSWWDGNRCTFVGDAKYKNIDRRPVPASDLYQLLAYTTALDLPGGMLIYAKGEAESTIHKVRHAAKQLEVASLDLSRPLDEILDRIEGLANRVRHLRDMAQHLAKAA